MGCVCLSGRGRVVLMGTPSAWFGVVRRGLVTVVRYGNGVDIRIVKAHLAQVGKALRRFDTDDTHFWEGIAVGSVVLALLTLLVGW